MGFANFYRRFIAGFSRIAQPLVATLKGIEKGKPTKEMKRDFILSDEAQRAFEELKAVFSSAPLLAHFDPAKLIVVETDASGYAIAGIISQPDSNPAQKHLRPVAYWSRKMADHERRYGVGDCEMLAVVEACR